MYTFHQVDPFVRAAHIYASSKLKGTMDTRLSDIDSVIDDECSKLGSLNRTVFRTTSAADFAGFHWEKYAQEISAIAPTLWTVLKAAATSLDTRYQVQKEKI